jgi:hypothetical protein
MRPFSLPIIGRQRVGEKTRTTERLQMSDEGLMTEDIESCLNVVLEALKTCDLPAAEVIAWCAAMKENDRIGFITREPLQSLRKQFQTTAPR